MRVAAVQFKPRRGFKDESLARLRALVEREAAQNDLIVLPELAATGYLWSSPEHARTVAEPPDGATFRALAPVAAALRTWLVVGFVESDGDALYNSALVIDPSGHRVGVYRKTLLFQPDYWWARPGDSGYLAFDTERGRFGVGICMDLNDDAFVEWLRGAGLRAVAFPTNWVQESEDPLDYWFDRLDGVDAALVAANSYGPEGPIAFTGRSAVLQRGVLLASGPTVGDAVIRATL